MFLHLDPFAGRGRAERCGRGELSASPFITEFAEAIADLQKNDDGVRVRADINSVRLADIAYDAKMLRVTAEAQGSISATISKVPEL